jgi:hypothetical protein
VGHLNKTFFIDILGKLRETSAVTNDPCENTHPLYLAEKIYPDPKDSAVFWIKAQDLVSEGTRKYRWLRFDGLNCQQLTEEY